MFLQALHSECLEAYELQKKSSKRPANDDAGGSNLPQAKSARQAIQSNQNPGGPPGTHIDKTVVENKILSLVAKGCLPLSLVEQDEFKDLLSCKYYLNIFLCN